MDTDRAPAERRLGRPPDPEAREERRQRILAAARGCFVQRGFHAATTAQISAAAGVSVANLYQYFASKDELVLALVEQDLAADLEMAHGVVDAPDLFAGIARAFRRVAEEARRSDDFGLQVEIFAEAQRNPAVREALAESERAVRAVLADGLRAAQARGEVRAEIDAAATASWIVCLLVGFYSAVGAGVVDPEPLRNAAVDAIRTALAPR